MIHKVLYSLLSADSQLTAIIGESIHPWPLDQGMSYPAVSYIIEDKPVTRCDSGIRIVTADVQVGIFSDSILQAETIGDHVTRILDRYAQPVAGVDVQCIFLINSTQDYDEEMLKHYVKQSYQITILT